MKKFLVLALVLFGLSEIASAAANTATLTPTSRRTRTWTMTPTSTKTPLPTNTPTYYPDNLHVNSIDCLNVYNAADLDPIVRADSTKVIWGYSAQGNIMQGSYYTISSEGPVTIDPDGGEVKWFRASAVAGPAGSLQWFNAAGTPVMRFCGQVPSTFTPVPSVNSRTGMTLLGEDNRISIPEATNTPSADELPKWSWVKSYVDYNPIQKSLTSSKGLLIGDSIMVETAATPVIGSMESYLLTNSDSLLGTTCYNQSVAGQGIAEQKAIWVSDANKATYDWIIIQVGLNNLVTPSEAATEVIADYQDFVDTINAGKKSTCALLASTLSPDYSVLVDLLGNTTGAAAYQKWLDVNEAIGGGGSTPVTGVHVHITEISDALNDGNGNLAYKYSYDEIHPNEAGRKVMAGIYRKHLNRLGFLANGSLIDKSGNPPMVSPVSMTVAQRDNLPAATIGDVVYNSTSKTLDYLFGDGWKSAGSIIKSATVTGPNPVSVGLDVDVAYCDTSAGSFVYRLPLATGSGRVIKFKKTNNDTNFVSVWADTTGTPDLIDGQAAIGLTTQYETLQIQDGAVNNWYTLSHDFCSIVPPPMATETPVAGDLVRKEYADAGVNAVSTPAYYVYGVATHAADVDALLPGTIATATPLISQFIRRDTADAYYNLMLTPSAANSVSLRAVETYSADVANRATTLEAHATLVSNRATTLEGWATPIPAALAAATAVPPIATRVYITQAVGTPISVPEFVGQEYFATDTEKFYRGIRPTSTPDPGNWVALN